MKQTERASIFRVVSDLIKADAIIDTREMEKLDSIREKYAIKKEDEILGSSYTLSKAEVGEVYVVVNKSFQFIFCAVCKEDVRNA
jgi:hypothetical protein